MQPTNIQTIAFAGVNADAEIRRQSSSGGIFTILATEVIDQGGVVYGAAYNDNFMVSHTRVTTIDGLAALRGSKYAFSDATKAYTQALADLETGRHVLFSGTPCQCAAMCARAKGHDENLLLVEVVCHGAPRAELWQRYIAELQDKHGKIKHIDMRDKRTGWSNYSFTVRYHSGKTVSRLRDDEPWLRAFIADLTLREACFKCPFKHPNSKADITLGDLWGIESVAPELANDQGTTLVIPNTTKGADHVKCLGDLTPIDLTKAIRHNPSIAKSTGRPAAYETFAHEASSARSIITLMQRHTRRPVILNLKIKTARLLTRFGLR